MAITFPRDLPAVKYTTAAFYQIDRFGSSRAGRTINVVEIADPAWRADMVTVPLRWGVLSEIEAWYLSLRGGLRSCRFVHPHALWPKNHYSNNTPAQTAGTVDSVTSGNILAVSALDTGLSLSLGDRIGLEKDALRAVGRITDFSGAGSTRSIEIEPPPPTDVAVATAVVRFAQPELLMRPIPGSFKATKTAGLYQASFSLIESSI